jgi:hypothetical protein
MALGVILVLALWVLSTLAVRARLKTGLAYFTFLWGALVVFIGIAQLRMMPGESHWIIRVIHLLMGLAAIAFAEMLGGALKRSMRQ